MDLRARKVSGAFEKRAPCPGAQLLAWLNLYIMYLIILDAWRQS